MNNIDELLTELGKIVAAAQDDDGRQFNEYQFKIRSIQRRLSAVVAVEESWESDNDPYVKAAIYLNRLVQDIEAADHITGALPYVMLVWDIAAAATVFAAEWKRTFPERAAARLRRSFGSWGNEAEAAAVVGQLNAYLSSIMATADAYLDHERAGDGRYEIGLILERVRESGIPGRVAAFADPDGF